MVVFGDGGYWVGLRGEIESRGVGEMFRLPGRKRPEEIPGYLAWCDAAFISFAESPLFGMTIPAKLQSYMACGMPILAAALIAQVGMGVLMKVIPQINVFAINIDLKVIIGLGLLYLLLNPISEFLLGVEVGMLQSLQRLLPMMSGG